MVKEEDAVTHADVYKEFYIKSTLALPKIVCNVIDDAIIAGNSAEFEKLITRRIQVLSLQEDLILFDDIYARIDEPEGFDPMHTELSICLIYKYGKTKWITTRLNIVINRVDKLVSAYALIELRIQKMSGEWESLLENYWTMTDSFERIKDRMKGSLL